MRTSWFLKFSESSLFFLAITNLLMILLEIIPREIATDFFEISELISIFLPFIFGLIYASLWHRQEKNDREFPVRHIWFRGIIRYWLSFSIASYGFAKIFRSQFGDNYHRLDTPVGMLNGFELTWNYFAFSYPMVCILGLIQISGAVLLLFRRTTLLGALILLPVMTNIILINIFYEISAGAFVNSLIFTIGLVFLVALRWRPLFAVLIGYGRDLPFIGRSPLKNVLRLCCLLLSAALIGYFVQTQNTAGNHFGKWEVVHLIKNRKLVDLSEWTKDSSAWNIVYFEESKMMICCPNPYSFDRKKSVWLIFEPIDKNAAKIISYENDKPSDTTKALFDDMSDKTTRMAFLLGKDSIVMDLKKVNGN